MRAFVVAGTHSGCGKTTITLGLLAAFRKQELIVQPFKAGPDFIDSGLHRLATGRVSRNLDIWMCGEEYVLTSFHRHSADADVSVIEGVMGLYDGDPSTATLAGALGIPAVLVVDAYGMAESAGALVKGFTDWGKAAGRPALMKGIIFNRVASENHYLRLKAAAGEANVLGYLPRDLSFEIPRRHLGLLVAEEEPVSAGGLDRLADTVVKHVDLNALLDLAVKEAFLIGPISPIRPIGPIKNRRSASVRIALASDRAFCFYYADNIDLLRQAGAEIVPFSPLTDRHIPESVDGVYIGGGYPELYAGPLSGNRAMRASIAAFAASGGAVYAECGGLMYLCRQMTDLDRNTFEMAGVFPFETTMTTGRARLGYREIVLNEDCLLGARGQRMRGHEFHYSRITGGRASPGLIYGMRNGSGEQLPSEGYRYKNALGSYVHVHFGSNGSIAQSFVNFIKQGRSL